MKEAGKGVEIDRKVPNKKETITKGKEKKTKPKERKYSEFKFGPDARKTVLDKK